MQPNWTAADNRYSEMPYRRSGGSGLNLPAISLGLWQNFGATDIYDVGLQTCLTAFDQGITHFDLANNYGPPYGSAEETFGKILKDALGRHRDELIISKAGWDMWPGPYGDFGSRKYLVASCDQSLKRMGLEYVDIFYHHRPDPATPLEETVRALDYIVRSGRALYVGISSYSPEDTRRAAAMLKDLGTPLLIHQPEYSMLNRKAEAGLLDTLDELSVGCIVFSPLAQGLLTNKYLGGIPADSRATRERYLKSDRITPGLIGKISLLNDVAQSRDQTLAQMAIQWVFRHDAVSSALVGARNSAQLFDCLQALRFAALTDAELVRIDAILASKL